MTCAWQAKTWWSVDGVESSTRDTPPHQAGVQRATGPLANQGVQWIIHAVGTRPHVPTLQAPVPPVRTHAHGRARVLTAASAIPGAWAQLELSSAQRASFHILSFFHIVCPVAPVPHPMLHRAHLDGLPLRRGDARTGVAAAQRHPAPGAAGRGALGGAERVRRTHRAPPLWRGRPGACADAAAMAGRQRTELALFAHPQHLARGERGDLLPRWGGGGQTSEFGAKQPVVVSLVHSGPRPCSRLCATCTSGEGSCLNGKARSCAQEMKVLEQLSARRALVATAIKFAQSQCEAAFLQVGVSLPSSPSLNGVPPAAAAHMHVRGPCPRSVDGRTA